jgi:hypothetical protein
MADRREPLIDHAMKDSARLLLAHCGGDISEAKRRLLGAFMAVQADERMPQYYRPLITRQEIAEEVRRLDAAIDTLGDQCMEP